MAFPTLLSHLEARELDQFDLFANFSQRKIAALSESLRDAVGWADVTHHMSVHRRFVPFTQDLLDNMRSRPLHELNLVGAWIDATKMGDHMVAWAIGLDTTGQRVPLTAVDGKEEDKALIWAMADNLHQRGVNLAELLPTADGGRRLLPALQEFMARRLGEVEPRLGWTAARVKELDLIQRCTFHLGVNVQKAATLEDLGKKLLAATEAGTAGRRAVSDDLKAESAHKIGATVLWQEVRRIWNRSTEASARQELKNVTAWLETMEQFDAADKLGASFDAAITVLRLGIDDWQVRRALRTTNPIEQPHSITSKRENFPAFQTSADPDVRLRHFVLMAAVAERGWQPVATESALVDASFKIMRGRHPEIGLGTSFDRPGFVVIHDVDFARGKELNAEYALRDVARWADRNGKAIELDAFALDGYPEAEASRLRDAVRPHVRPPVVAISGVRRAVDRDERLVAAVSQAALEIAPSLVGLDRAALEAKATDAQRASAELAGIAEEVDDWFARNEKTAGRPIAAAWLNADERPASPLTPTHRRLLGERRSEVLNGEAYLWAKRWMAGLRTDARAMTDAESPLVELQGAVARFDRAATALAASQVLAMHRRIDAALERAAEQPPAEPVGRLTAGRIKSKSRALGKTRADLLTGCAQAWSTPLGKLPPDVLARLDSDLGEPWKGLDPDAARALVAIEGELAGIVGRRRDAFRRAVDAERRDEHELAARWQEAAAGLLPQLDDVDAKLARVRNVDSDLAARPEVALHAAVGQQLASPARALEVAGHEVGVGRE
jgi:hypothetical protein